VQLCPCTHLRMPKIQAPRQVSAARRLAWLQWRTTGDRCEVRSGEPSMMEGDDPLVDRDAFDSLPGLPRALPDPGDLFATLLAR
jgi:hypothetical protein